MSGLIGSSDHDAGPLGDTSVMNTLW